MRQLVRYPGYIPSCYSAKSLIAPRFVRFSRCWNSSKPDEDSIDLELNPNPFSTPRSEESEFKKNLISSLVNKLVEIEIPPLAEHEQVEIPKVEAIEDVSPIDIIQKLSPYINKDIPVDKLGYAFITYWSAFFKIKIFPIEKYTPDILSHELLVKLSKDLFMEPQLAIKHVGLLIKNNSVDKIHKLVNKYLLYYPDVQTNLEELSDSFPEVDLKEFDLTFLYYMDKSIEKRKTIPYELPKFPKDTYFHPLLIFGDDITSPITKKSASKRVKNLSDMLYRLGIASVDLYSTLFEEGVKFTGLDDNLINSIVLRSNLHRIFKSEMETALKNLKNNDELVRRTFFLYIGLLTLINRCPPIEWLSSIKVSTSV